jgi:DnaJ family protein A protein 2
MSYYDTLGVKQNVSQEDLKKAYRGLARKHHPDKGGNPDDFKKINEAFETLSDQDKRIHYDRFGTADPQGPNSQRNPFDIFEQFFGNQQQPTRKRDTSYDFSVSLEDAFKGKTVQLNVNHNVCCKTCDGNGSTKPPVTCDICRGVGYIQHMVQMGPMRQIVRQHCSNCDGKGHSCDPQFICNECKGKCTVKATERIDVHIRAGVRNRSTITVSGMGDYHAKEGKSDLVLRIRYKEHPIIRSDGENLVINKTIHIYESLCGAVITYTHLDGIVYQFNIHRVIKTGDVIKIPTMGMTSYAYLHIECDVEFPKCLIKKDEQLQSILKYNAFEHTVKNNSTIVEIY